ncbi:HAMP domain-containing sensor histidine kinase, partial [Patulibacter sp. NPDC049589]|uniref:sensor histidine kinase n=1 Tax=Patulibacter sp. NPDC049589 TaxID=3154731 RepID=UPI00341474AB
MPLRRRLSLTVAVVALLVVVAAGAAAWLTTRSVLRGNVDDSLRAQARFATRVPRFRVPGGVASPTGSGLEGVLRVPGPPPGQGGPSEYQQFLTGDGQIIRRTEDDVQLPVQGADRVVVAGGGSTSPRDVEVGGAHLRMVTVPVSVENRLLYRSRLGVDVAAVQFARSMTGVDSALRTLWIVLLALGVVIVATAALLARATARRVLRPVTDLAAAAAHVEATADLGGRLPVRSQDEVGELTRRFNGMLTRLQGSREELDRSMVEQRNLVADASHELRTPVTSLRTNAEVLLEDDASLSPEERRGILSDVRDQAEDLGLLVADLIELARGDAPDRGADEPVALDALVEECVGRARRDHRGVTFATTLQPVVVAGRPDRLARAVSNLVNNAALHGADGSGAVEVLVSAEAGDPAPVGEQRVSRARPEATRTDDVDGADGQAAVGRAREGRSAEGRPPDAPPSGAPLRPARAGVGSCGQGLG